MFRLLNYTTKNFNKRLLKNYIVSNTKSITSGLFKLQNKTFFGFNPHQNANPNNKKYYEILEVDRNASEDEIKRSFRKKAMQHHPDRGGDPDKVTILY
jgi:DnaJ-domain-containing protein 1